MNARSSRVFALFLALALLVSQAGVSSAQSALSASPYTTVSGLELAWDAPWSFVEDDAMLTSDLDLVFLTDGMATVAVSTGSIMPENARGLVIGFLGGDTEALEILDAGAGATTSYWFDAFPIDDEPFGAFSTATAVSANVSVLTMYISPVDSFAQGMTSVQEAITLGGDPLFANVDGSALQDQLGVPTDAADDAAFPEFEPDGQWVDRTFDVQVMWDEMWMPLGPDGDHSFQIGSVDSATLLTVTIAPRDGTTPQDWADAQVQGRDDNWGTYTYLPQYVGEDDVLTIGLEVSGLGGLVQEVLFLDDGETIAIVTMAVLDGDPMAMVEAYRASVRIDGRVPLENLDVTTLMGETEFGGLSADGHYTSPQYGVELEWDTTTWEPWPSLAEAAISDPAQRVDGFMLASRTVADASLIVYMGSTEGLDLGGFVTYNAEPEVYLANYGEDATLLETVVEGERAANVFRATTATGPTLIYETYELANDGSVMVVIVYEGPASSIPETLLAAQGGLTLEGEPVLDLLTVEHIQELLSQ